MVGNLRPDRRLASTGSLSGGRNGPNRGRPPAARGGDDPNLPARSPGPVSRRQCRTGASGLGCRSDRRRWPASRRRLPRSRRRPPGARANSLDVRRDAVSAESRESSAGSYPARRFRVRRRRISWVERPGFRDLRERSTIARNFGFVATAMLSQSPPSPPIRIRLRSFNPTVYRPLHPGQVCGTPMPRRVRVGRSPAEGRKPEWSVERDSRVPGARRRTGSRVTSATRSSTCTCASRSGGRISRTGPPSPRTARPGRGAWII